MIRAELTVEDWHDVRVAKCRAQLTEEMVKATTLHTRTIDQMIQAVLIEYTRNPDADFNVYTKRLVDNFGLDEGTAKILLLCAAGKA